MPPALETRGAGQDQPWSRRPVLVAGGDRRSRDEMVRLTGALGMQAVSASSLADTVDLAKARRPEFLIIDVDFVAGRLELELVAALRARWGLAVIFVGSRFDPDTLGALSACQPSGVLCKPVNRGQLDATLRLSHYLRLQLRAPASEPREVTSGVGDVCQCAVDQVLRRVASLTGHEPMGGAMSAVPDGARVELLSQLRPREQEVVRLLFQHDRVPAIAQRLGISPQTVRNHLKGAFRRLGVHSQQDLLVRLKRELR